MLVQVRANLNSSKLGGVSTFLPERPTYTNADLRAITRRSRQAVNLLMDKFCAVTGTTLPVLPHGSGYARVMTERQFELLKAAWLLTAGPEKLTYEQAIRRLHLADLGEVNPHDDPQYLTRLVHTLGEQVMALTEQVRTLEEGLVNIQHLLSDQPETLKASLREVLRETYEE